MHYAVIDASSKVVNVVDLEQGSTWPLPPGHTLIATEEGGIGDTLQDGKFIEVEEQKALNEANEPARQAEQARMVGLHADDQARQMADRLADMTSAQIDQYFASNVTNLAQLGGVVKNICKILAVKLTPRFSEPG